MNIQLNNKEFPIKIDMEVLEEFEEETGEPALSINLKSIKQIRVLLTLALKKAGVDNPEKKASAGMGNDLTGVINSVMEIYLKVVMPDTEEPEGK